MRDIREDRSYRRDTRIVRRVESEGQSASVHPFRTCGNHKVEDRTFERHVGQYRGSQDDIRIKKIESTEKK